jgi:putative hemolysin
MTRKVWFTLFVLIGIVFFASCNPRQISPTPEANMPNPASVFCEQNGGQVEFRQDASGGVVGICVFPDGSECDEWAYFRGECSPASSTPTQDSTSAPTDIPTPVPFELADYQGWWTYTHPAYGFSLLLPPDWVVNETTTGDPLMNGHMLSLHPRYNIGEDLLIRMTFRRVGDDALLWPTGVGSGEFVPQGTLDVAGQPARRILFVCPTGQVNEIWYHGETDANIQRGNTEFGFIFSYAGHYCQDDYSLGGKVQRVGEMIIASLAVP